MDGEETSKRRTGLERSLAIAAIVRTIAVCIMRPDAGCHPHNAFIPLKNNERHAAQPAVNFEHSGQKIMVQTGLEALGGEPPLLR